MCVCICIYVYLYVYILIYMYLYVYIYLYTHIYIYNIYILYIGSLSLTNCLKRLLPRFSFAHKPGLFSKVPHLLSPIEGLAPQLREVFWDPKVDAEKRWMIVKETCLLCHSQL